MPPHPLTNFEIQKYYQNESRFNGVYSRNNLPKKAKDEAYVINLYKYADAGTRWMLYFVEEVKLFVLIVLVLNMFLKKLKILSEIKNKSQHFSSTSKQFNNICVLFDWIH